MATNVTSLVHIEPKIPDRWVQMCASIIAMMAIANLQYAWTLFTKPLTSSLHATLAAVQIAFAAFIFCETWLVPFEGYLVDRLGPRLIVGIGGLLVGAGWIGSGSPTPQPDFTSGTRSVESALAPFMAAAPATS